MDSITELMDMSLRRLWELVMDREAWHAAVHGISQARILEWDAMLSSRESSQPRDQNWVSYVSSIGKRVLYHYCHLGSPEALFSSVQFSRSVVSNSVTP